MASRPVLVAAVSVLALTGPACRPTVEPASEEVTFHRDVAPIIHAKCATCHRPGEAGPFPLLSYDDVRRRAKQIAEVTATRFMPPWLPKEGHGEFADARRLTPAEVETLAAWAAAGAPRGGGPAPPVPKFAEGWQLGPPDLVLESPPFTLPAGGGDVFRNFVVPVELDGPRWVKAVELRPTNPQVTHHARLGIDASYESVRRDAEDAEPGYDGMAWGEDPEGQLVTWTPGMVAHPTMPGSAWRLRPQTALVLHSHLQPSGKPETVQFRIGFHFSDEAPTVRPVMLRIGSREIDIPAGAARFRVADEYALPVDVELHSIFPHAHSLARDVRVDARRPDGTRQPLLRIENFDENWHDVYRYATPVRLPRGTVLVTEFVYDNSAANPRNRHRPPRRTVYGSNADDEMQDVYLQVTPVRADQRAMLVEDYEQYERRSRVAGHRKTLEMYPDDPWSREGLAACYLADGKPAEAVRVLEERLKLGRPDAHATAAFGMACLAAGDAARAAEAERHAIGLDGEFALAWFGLGQALAAAKQLGEAEDALHRALELAPAFSDAHMSLADILSTQGRFDEAAAACEAARQSTPEDANPLLKLAEIRARQRRYDESLELLVAAQRLAPYTHPPKVLLAVFLVQAGDFDRARGLLEESAAALPNHPVPPLFLGQLARHEEQFDAARRRLDAAASLPLPDNWPQSHRKRFLVLLHSERLQLAQQLQDEALARDALAAWLEIEPENEMLRAMDAHLRSAPESP